MYSKSKKPGASDKTSFARSSKNSKKSGKVLLPETPAQLQVDVSEAEYASESGLSNQAMQRLLQSRAIQSKLKINQLGDKYEQEADRVANEVMRMPEPNFSASSQYASVSAPSRIQRMCSECEEEELQRQPVEEEEEKQLLQAKEIPGQTPEINSNIETNINAVRSGGRPLSKSVRNYFEPRFGHDFSQVRIHTDSRAAESSQALKARAFTLGNNIVFNNREYAPTSLRGKQLLAHELTHVVQQQRTVLNTIQRQHTCENDPLRAPTMICDIGIPSISGPTLDIFFDIESKTVSRAGDFAALQNLVRNWHAFGGTDRVRVDGFASCDARPNLNWPLSCDRAMAVAHELLNPLDPTLAGIDRSFVEFFANGETDRFSTTSLEPNRRATVTLIPHSPSPNLARPIMRPSFEETKTELGGLWVGNFDISFTPCNLTISVNVYYHFESGISVGQQNAFKLKFMRAVQIWNNGYGLSFIGIPKEECPCCYIPIRIEVHQTSRADAHKVIDVEKDYRDAYVFGDVNTWIGEPEKTLAHEFGHVLGLYDEYDGGWIRNMMWWSVSGHRLDVLAVMNDGNELRDRYFINFSNWVNKMFNGLCTYRIQKGGNTPVRCSPPGDYNFPIDPRTGVAEVKPVQNRLFELKVSAGERDEAMERIRSKQPPKSPKGKVV